MLIRRFLPPLVPEPVEGTDVKRLKPPPSTLDLQNENLL